MNLNKLRQRLTKKGLLLLEHGDGWTVTDEGVKVPFEKNFPNLAEVEKWMNPHTNRLTEKEADLFDAEFKAFAEKENERR